MRICLLALILALVGCKEKPKDPAPSSPQTPKIALAEDLKADAGMAGRLRSSLPEKVVKETPPGEDSKPELINLDVPTPGSEPGDQKVEELLNQVTDRHRCNRVMGCKPGDELVALGAVAVDPIIKRFDALGRWTWQRNHLILLLGRIGDPKATDFLLHNLTARHWEARAYAARGLAMLGAKQTLPRLRTLLHEKKDTLDLGFAYSLAWAVEVLGGTEGNELLLRALSEETVKNTNWGYTTIAAEAVADLKLNPACPLLVSSLQHKDVFLRKAALQAATTIPCPALLPIIKPIAQKDPIPSARRLADQFVRRYGTPIQ